MRGGGPRFQQSLCLCLEAWFNRYRHFKEEEDFLKPGNITKKPNKEGYKNFVHIPFENPNWLRFGGDLGQAIYIDHKTGTVMVILSVNNNAQAYSDLFKASIATLGLNDPLCLVL